MTTGETTATSKPASVQADNLETLLWASADKLRNNMDAAEYKHVVLGLIFLKYISDAFDERFQELSEEAKTDKGVDPEDRDEYLADGVFWVPKESRWEFIQARAKQADIGKIIDDAMSTIEADNISLKNVLPKEYARASLDKRRVVSYC
jgi:type I restriction enzyme M protein